MEIQDLFSSPAYQETMSRFKNNVKENSRHAFADLISKREEQPMKIEADVLGNAAVDNGVKSTLLLGQLASREQTTGAMSTTLPEGLQKVNAYGLTIKGHNAPTGEPNHFETIDDYRHELIPLYDTNSPEDSPVMYIIDHDQLNDTDTVHRIEVNKINPLTATYEEMVALVGYTYRDDPSTAMEASDALVHARDYMEMEGIDPDGPKDYVLWLREVVRRNIDYPNPSNQAIGKAAQSLLEYLKDYPRA